MTATEFEVLNSFVQGWGRLKLSWECSAGREDLEKKGREEVRGLHGGPNSWLLEASALETSGQGAVHEF